MSESDYQRGLRGGSCPVSIHDYDRWRDWKDGNDKYEEEQDRIAEESLLQLLPEKEKINRLQNRFIEIQNKENKRIEDEAKYQIKRKSNAFENAKKEHESAINIIIVTITILAVTGALIFVFIFNNSPLLPLIGGIIFIWYNINKQNSNYKKQLEELNKKTYF